MVECGEEIVAWFKYEQYKNVGIFTFLEDIGTVELDELKGLLMQSIEKMDRVVLNFRREIKMDRKAREMFNSAYRASERLNKPVIFNGYKFDRRAGTSSKRTMDKLS